MANIRTSSQQIVVEITNVHRDMGYVSGWKQNKQRGGRATPFNVFFRSDEPVATDGIGRPHPKLVLAAASAAWRN